MAIPLSTLSTGVTLHQDERPQETIFDTLDKWKQYPYNITPYIQPRGRPRLVAQIKRYYENVKSNSLFTLDESMGPARRNAIERKIRTLWFDSNHAPEAGAEHERPNSGDSEPRPRNRRKYGDDEPIWIKGNSQLVAFLGIFGENSQPRPDPIWRFITLQTSAPGSPRLRITDQLLLKILSYHHVSPYFLDHLSHVCHELPTGITETPFSGFQGLRSFSSLSLIPEFEALDRSGLHYQLIFNLRTVNAPDNTADSSVSSEVGLNLWPITQCAVYHRFDIRTGKSLWILTPPGTPSSTRGSAGEGLDNDVGIPPWDPQKSNTTGQLLSHFGVPYAIDSSSSITERFSASLTIMTWLADWSLSEYDSYIASIEEQLGIISLLYLSSTAVYRVHQITLKTLNQYIETLDQVIAALESNLSILQSIKTFYSDFPRDPNLAVLDPCPSWLLNVNTVTDSSEPNMSQTEALISNFTSEISSICSTYNELILRANTVKQTGTRREDTLYRLIQQAESTETRRLQQVTYIFSAITLLLLPMSVVSTIFSTDIVKFAFPDGAGKESSNNTITDGRPDFGGTWSAPAVVWWIVTTVIATVSVGSLGEWWRRKSWAKMRLGEGIVPSERVIRGLSEGTDLLDTSDGAGGEWLRGLKRGYADLEGKARAKFQWVRGNVAMIRQRLVHARLSSKGGYDMEMDTDLGGLGRDPERVG
ncbi:hypothetical protein V8F20_001526 [Naviculisporaceae sp. PSN 640]